jgi:hypothetical protein
MRHGEHAGVRRVAGDAVAGVAARVSAAGAVCLAAIVASVVGVGLLNLWAAVIG